MLAMCRKRNSRPASNPMTPLTQPISANRKIYEGLNVSFGSLGALSEIKNPFNPFIPTGLLKVIEINLISKVDRQQMTILNLSRRKKRPHNQDCEDSCVFFLMYRPFIEYIFFVHAIIVK